MFIYFIMNIINILNKVKVILGDRASEYFDFKLNEKPSYDDIVNLWYYYITVSKEYRTKYNRPEYNKEILRKIINYRNFYTKEVEYIFNKHSFSKDNILLFLIKNQEKLLVFLKDESNPEIFTKIYLPKDSILKINSKLLEIDCNTIRILYYCSK